MLISLDWIRDFCALDKTLTPKELGLRLTMGTAEVEGVEHINEFWKNIKTVEVTDIEPHPEADKLNLVRFKLNDQESFRVVCGAANVKVGMKTVFAPIGTTLPIGFTLEPKKIRGILSEGMLCSEEELGLADESKGIMELSSETPVGVDLSTLWEKKQDVLFDIDNKSLTHRPDLWGHFGMAREFATLYGVPLDNPFTKEWEKSLEEKVPGGNSPIKVSVSKESSCLAYFGLSLKGVRVTESPQWIKDRLLAVGLRPINNIVDISNYVMTELGMPLHIFDRKKIKGGQVSIKALSTNEKFTTLDEVERELLAGDTVICDEEKNLVLAGIMGGLNSGVDEDTTEIFIEVANWKAAEVRKTSTRLGLRTDSSMRYEKTLDSQLCYRTLLRTLEFVLKQCPNATVEGSVEYDGENLKDFSPLEMNISPVEITKTLGKDIPVNRIVEILESLDFKVEKSDSLLKLVVPSYRSTKDIECPADIIEEIGRVVGYDNIEPIGPLLDVRPVRLSPLQTLKRRSQDFLTQNAKSLEITTYPMIGEALLSKCSWPESYEDLKLLNSLSVDNDRMRGSLIPSFLEVTSLNSKNQSQFRFFEWGRTYNKGKDTFSVESTILGITYFSKSQNQCLELLNDVETLSRFLNIPIDICDQHPKFKNEVVPEDWVGVHPYEFKNLRVMGKMKGAVLSIHPIILKKLKIKGHLSMAFLDLSGFEKHLPKEKVSYKPLAKFPSSRFDYTVELKNEQSVQAIFDALKQVKIKADVGHKIVDIFTPDSEKKFITMGTILSDPAKTLEGDFIKECEEKIISSLESKGILLKRG